jgi:hypothetical protein
MDKVIEAIEIVFTQRPTPPRPPKATLRDPLDLDTRYDIWEKDTDLGAVLARLDAKTLGNLEHFLKEHREEAMDRPYWHQYTYLCSQVGMRAAYTSLPPDKPLPLGKPDTPSDEVIRTRRGYVVDRAALNNALLFEAAYTSSARSEKLKTPLLAAILAEALRQNYPRITERAIEDTIEEVIGSYIPRSPWREGPAGTEGGCPGRTPRLH